MKSKKSIYIILSLILCSSFYGCEKNQPDSPVETSTVSIQEDLSFSEFDEILSGTWQSEYMEVVFYDKTVESKCLDNGDMPYPAGVIEQGKLKVKKDGTFSIDYQSFIDYGQIVDENTIIINDVEYHR